MVVAPTILPPASATSASDTVGGITFCVIPTKPTRPDVTRPNGLPETIQMEDVSVADQVSECREFPHSTRHHMTVVTTMPEDTGPYNDRLHYVVPRPRKWTGS